MRSVRPFNVRLPEISDPPLDDRLWPNSDLPAISSREICSDDRVRPVADCRASEKRTLADFAVGSELTFRTTRLSAIREQPPAHIREHGEERAGYS